jgi:nucleoid-associated protein YgaU
MFDSSVDIEHVFGKDRRVDRVHIHGRRSAVVAIAMVVSLCVPAVSRAVTGERSDASTRYVVRAGDTVWSIAARRAPGQDPRPIVDAIVRANDLDPANLVPGEELVLPG